MAVVHLCVAIVAGVVGLGLGREGRGAVFEAGVSRVDITPPLSLHATLGGYGERMNRPATGVHDRVWAKVLVLRGEASGTQRVAIVTADVLGFPPGFKRAVLAKLKAGGWTEDQLLLLASHSHTSMDMSALNPANTFGIPQIGLFHAELFERTVSAVAQVVQQGAAQLKPARAGYRMKPLEGWSRNRRRGGGGVTDPELLVVRVDTLEGKPLAVLVNWAAHPTFMGPEDMMFSGDWPGQMQRCAEAIIGDGATVLFANGAEGDQSPTPRLENASGWEQAETYGRGMALHVVEAWREVQTRDGLALQVALQPLSLPPRKAHPDFMSTGGREYGLNESNVGKLLEAMVPERSHSVQVRLGDLVLAGVPGEMTAALGRDLKARLKARTGAGRAAVLGLADEWISYLISPEDYAVGGYESSVSFYGPQLGNEIVRQIGDATPLGSGRKP